MTNETAGRATNPRVTEIEPTIDERWALVKAANVEMFESWPESMRPWFARRLELLAGELSDAVAIPVIDRQEWAD